MRIEDVKAAGVNVDIDRLAASGFESISDEDKYRLKTQGICSQRDVGVFMIRIRIPGVRGRFACALCRGFVRVQIRDAARILA